MIDVVRFGIIYVNASPDFLSFLLQTVVSRNTVRGAKGHVTVLWTRHVMLRQESAQVDYVPRVMKERHVIVGI